MKLVELDIDSTVKKGVLTTNQQKARLSEIIIRDHFEKHPVDSAGENYLSPCDGICPNGKTYDVKGSKLYEDKYYHFVTKNRYKEEIEIYYFLAFDDDYTKLKHGWRVPGEIVENDRFIIGLTRNCRYSIDNMKKYDITDKLKDIFEIMKKDMLKK